MVVPIWVDKQLLGPFAFNNAAANSVTEQYIYVVGMTEAAMQELIGTTSQDGGLTDFFQSMTAVNPDASTAVVETDSDANSPYFNRDRMKTTVG